jgi:two-component system LytT family response regulator
MIGANRTATLVQMRPQPFCARTTAENGSVAGATITREAAIGSMKYRAVLVENEEHSLARLRRLLAGFAADVEIVGEAMDGPSAVEEIRTHAPDLVFLDIDLPGLNGFQVLQKLDRQPMVIFTTAFDQHALDAFKTRAVDYLLKPIDTSALARTFEKLRDMGFRQQGLPEVLQDLIDSSSSRYLTRLSCKVGDRIILLKLGEILYFQADSKYTSVFTASNDYLIDTPLVELEGRLSPREFIRIHRSTLVNVAWIAEIQRSYDGKLKVVLKDPKATELWASRTYADNLKRL